ncbi:MAG: Bax inhibitor-1/YccA family protein [Bacteroidaceae bacterium]|nr:Bax inhibitor-1/YccA family protein [Bacteroidaceae bacterium]
MTAALVISGLTAKITAEHSFISDNVTISMGMAWVIFFALLAYLMFVPRLMLKLSFPIAAILYTGYAVLMGWLMSYIFIVYTASSIASVFFITAGTFGAISLYGYTTKRDLSSWGTILLMGLIGLFIASLVNLFLQSEMLYWILTYVGVLLFVALTAYDTQRIKDMINEMAGDSDASRKVALFGAMILYLDFINLFLRLLRIFGKRK